MANRTVLVWVLHFEGSRTEWCISTIYHAWDTPFWSGTLKFCCPQCCCFPLCDFFSSRKVVNNEFHKHKTRTITTFYFTVWIAVTKSLQKFNWSQQSVSHSNQYIQNILNKKDFLWRNRATRHQTTLANIDNVCAHWNKDVQRVDQALLRFLFVLFCFVWSYLFACVHIFVVVLLIVLILLLMFLLLFFFLFFSKRIFFFYILQPSDQPIVMFSPSCWFQHYHCCIKVVLF